MTSISRRRFSHLSILAVLSAGTLFANGCGEPGPEPFGATFARDGIVIEMPTGWTKTKDGQDEDSTVVHFKPDAGTLLQICIEYLDSEIVTAERESEYDKFWLGVQKKSSSGVQITLGDAAILENSDILAKKAPLKLINSDGKVYKGYFYAAFAPQRIYDVVIATAEDQYSSNRATMEAVIDSVVLNSVALTKVPVDWSGLNTAISEAEALDAAVYTLESYGLLTNALASARETLQNDSATQKQVNAATNALQEAENRLVTLEEQAQAEARAAAEASRFGPGTFLVGVDAPTCELLIEPVGGSGYACVYPDTARSEILENNNFSGPYIITVCEGQMLELSRCTGMPYDMAPHSLETFRGPGTWKIGVDMPAGTWRVDALDGTGYWCIYSSSDPWHDIVDNNNFQSNDYVKLWDGCYFELSRATATLV